MDKLEYCTFYASYYEAIKELDEKDQAIIYKTIFEYCFEGIIPELKGTCKIVWTLIKPQIDSNIRNFLSGKKGGRPTKKTPLFENEKPPLVKKINQEEEEEKEEEKKEEKKRKIKNEDFSNYSQKIIKDFNALFDKKITLSEAHKACIKRAYENNYSTKQVKTAFSNRAKSDWWKKNGMHKDFVSMFRIKNKNQEPVDYIASFSEEVLDTEEAKIKEICKMYRDDGNNDKRVLEKYGEKGLDILFNNL